MVVDFASGKLIKKVSRYQAVIDEVFTPFQDTSVSSISISPHSWTACVHARKQATILRHSLLPNGHPSPRQYTQQIRHNLHLPSPRTSTPDFLLHIPPLAPPIHPRARHRSCQGYPTRHHNPLHTCPNLRDQKQATIFQSALHRPIVDLQSILQSRQCEIPEVVYRGCSCREQTDLEGGALAVQRDHGQGEDAVDCVLAPVEFRSA